MGKDKLGGTSQGPKDVQVFVHPFLVPSESEAYEASGKARFSFANGSIIGKKLLFKAPDCDISKTNKQTSKFAGILSAALPQHHLLGFETA